MGLEMLLKLEKISKTALRKWHCFNFKGFCGLIFLLCKLQHFSFHLHYEVHRPACTLVNVVVLITILCQYNYFTQHHYQL